MLSPIWKLASHITTCSHRCACSCGSAPHGNTLLPGMNPRRIDIRRCEPHHRTTHTRSLVCEECLHKPRVAVAWRGVVVPARSVTFVGARDTLRGRRPRPPTAHLVRMR
jgi:hypothetical protein